MLQSQHVCMHCHSERSHAVNLHSVLYTAKMHCYVITALSLRNDQAGGGGNMRSANLASSIRTTAMQVRRWCL